MKLQIILMQNYELHENKMEIATLKSDAETHK